MPRVYKPKRRSRTPIANSADRSQKERDRFFGGRAVGGSLQGSKSTRGYRRPVGKDIRSKAAKAAGTGISTKKATLRPSEVAEADRLDKIADSLADETAVEEVVGQNVRSPEPLPEAPVKSISESFMSPAVREAIAAGPGPQAEAPLTPGADAPLPLTPLPWTGEIDPSYMAPPLAPLPWTGEPDPSYMAPPGVDDDKTPLTPGADTPHPDKITRDYLMGRTPTTPGADAPLPEGDPLTLKYLRGEDIPTPGVDDVPLPEQPLAQSYRGQGMGGATELPPMEEPKGLLAQLMRKYPKATKAWQEEAERRAQEAFWKDPTAAQREQEERKFFPDPHKGYEPTADEQKASEKSARKSARKSRKRWKKAGRQLKRMGIID
jgi:hypothetical protein